MLMRTLVGLALVAPLAGTGCIAGAGGDGHDVATVDDGVKGVAVKAGAYENFAATWHGDDLGFLDLLGDGRWLGTLCVDASCNEYVAQDGHYVVNTSSGKSYLYFYAGGTNQTGGWKADPGQLQAVYQVKAAASGALSLRKAYTSRWFSLTPVTDQALCSESGGAWDAAQPAGAQCDCSAQKGIFLAGEGGCAPAPVPSESLCDNTQGSWNDDDSNLLTTFCDCGVDRTWVDGTGCVDY